VEREEERPIKRGQPAFTEEEYRERLEYYLGRIPYKEVKMRYASFTRYFSHLKRLGWVKETGREEPSALQEVYPPAPPRRYYRLTRKGIEAPDPEWSRPQRVLYPEIGGISLLAYTRERRNQHHYSKKSPTKRRTPAT
jgi:hypothetical protein